MDHAPAPITRLTVPGPASPPGVPSGAPVVLDARVVTGAGGGPEQTILTSPRHLGPLGYRMLCACMYTPGDPGVETIRQRAGRYGAPLVEVPDRGAWDWRVIAQLLAVCKRERVAIWHGHDYKTNALGLLLNRSRPMRLVTTVHGWVEQTPRTPPEHTPDRLCLPRYERVICVSDDLLGACLACGVPAENCVVIENAIDAAEYTRRQSVAEAKAALGLPPDGLVVGAVGRLAEERSFAALVRSAHALTARGLDVRLVIVGEGDARTDLERLADDLGVRDRLLLPGWQADVRGYFEAMDVFALSGRREGLPNVLLEAMALEVPVVAARMNGVSRLVQDGRNGFLVEPGDPNGLTTALLGLLTNPGLRDLFRTAGRRTVETRYAFRTRTQRLKRVYDELLAG
jgi:glycosyltransferase involved in cell wall biosynthesis